MQHVCITNKHNFCMELLFIPVNILGIFFPDEIRAPPDAHRGLKWQKYRNVVSFAFKNFGFPRLILTKKQSIS